MRTTTDYRVFHRTTGIISCPMRLKELGLTIEDEIVGNIWPREMTDVLHFCEENPTFHIVSYMGDGIMINRYHQRGHVFKLAEGDRDPQYILDARDHYRWLFAKDPKIKINTEYWK